MKKILLIAFTLILSISLTACGGASKDKGNSEKQSVSTAKKMDLEEGQNKLMEISDKIMNGEITPEEAEKMQKEIKDNMDSQEEFMKRTNDNISEFKTVPVWAKKIGAPEVNGLTLDPARSTVVEAGNGYIQHFEAIYTGSKEEVLAEANRIGDKLGLKTTLEIEGLLTLDGDLSNGYTATVQVTYDSESNATLTYNIHAKIVNAVQKPNL